VDEGVGHDLAQGADAQVDGLDLAPGGVPVDDVQDRLADGQLVHEVPPSGNARRHPVSDGTSGRPRSTQHGADLRTRASTPAESPTAGARRC
jgi:hypothetical protein